jgi:hypothetical protein
MTAEIPVGLLYILTPGRDKELVLRLHGSAPTTEDLFDWMHNGTVRALTVSRYGDEATSVLVLNFAHVVAARIAPYSESRSGLF